MDNKQRGVKTTKHNCKVRIRIEVESDAYNKDEAFAKEIGNDLVKLFNDIKPEL